MRYVKGEGPQPAEVMLIGEAPGMTESQKGRPFCGKSGAELDGMLERNGLHRDDVYVTNICKLQPAIVNGKQQAPSKEEIERDTPELLEELLRVRPKWVGAVGRVAAQWLCGADVVTDMEAAHGMAFPLSTALREKLRAAEGYDLSGSTIICTGIESEESSLFEDSGPKSHWTERLRVVPLYHPAAGLHNADLQPFVWWDIQQFAGYVSGRLHPVTPTDRFPHPRYVDEVSESSGLRLYGVPVACDTEGLAGRVWGGSVSSEGGSALVTRLRDTQELKAVLDAAPTIYFHNALHDVPILEEINIPVDWQKVEDTFLMAYCLRLVPQGLKQLARRFCGMEMQSYLDVVAPADRRLALEYVQRALEAKRCPMCEGAGKIRSLRKDGKGWKKQPEKCTWEGCIDGGLWPDRDPQLKYDWETGQWKLSKGWSVGRYLQRLEKDLAEGRFEVDEDTGEALNARKRVQNWPDDVVELIEQEIGELPEPTLDDIPAAEATYYSARDADATIRIAPILEEQLDALELREAYRLDLSVIPVAAEMQRNGMHVDRQYFAALGKRLERDNQIILANLEQLAGRPINPASGEQVVGLLFGERGLKFDRDDERSFLSSFDIMPEKLTKSGKRAATDDKVLEGLKLKYASDVELVSAIDLILNYRIRHKLKGTYVDKLPLMVDDYDRIHTTIKPCRTATFRWASADPNFQNIPTRPKAGVDLGKLVRYGFTAEDGYVMGSWDFDQIEMRVLGALSQDANLMRVFREGLDIHSMTAALVFRVPLEQFTFELECGTPEQQKLRKEQRASAKNIGFGVVYGVTARGLRAQMELRGQHWTEEECQRLIDQYLYEAYPGVGEFMMEAHAEARRTGMVRSVFGHLRYCPGVHSRIASVREEALRQAANFKIQCSAAELLKVSMRSLWHDYKPVLDEVGARLLMAVHDEVLMEVPDNEEAKEIVDAVVTATMTNPIVLAGVEVGTTGKYDYNWGGLK